MAGPLPHSLMRGNVHLPLDKVCLRPRSRPPLGGVIQLHTSTSLGGPDLRWVISITVPTRYYNALGRVPLVAGNGILVSKRSSAALQRVYSPRCNQKYLVGRRVQALTVGKFDSRLTRATPRRGVILFSPRVAARAPSLVCTVINCPIRYRHPLLWWSMFYTSTKSVYRPRIWPRSGLTRGTCSFFASWRVHLPSEGMGQFISLVYRGHFPPRGESIPLPKDEIIRIPRLSRSSTAARRVHPSWVGGGMMYLSHRSRFFSTVRRDFLVVKDGGTSL